MIQQLLNAGTSTVVIPPGVHDVLEHTRLTIPNSVERIIGDGATLRVVDASGNPSTAIPTTGLLHCGLRPNSRLEIRGLTIEGPDCSAWPQNTNNPTGAIEWVHSHTWAATLIIDDVTVTGGYGYGVYRSGGGRLDIVNSSLSGWVGAYAFFESHNGTGTNLVRNCTFAAPTRSKHSSIGAYLHPHLDVTWDNVVATDWNRFAIYLNGSPQSAGHHLFTDVTATNCSLIQTGSSSETTLVRCVEEGIPKNGGSFIKGPLLSVGSTWRGNGMMGFMAGNAPTRRFVRDTIATPRQWIAAAANSAGQVVLNQCAVEFVDRTRVIGLTNRSTVAVTVVSTTHTGTGTSLFPYNIEGGSLRFVDTVPPANVRVVAPGVLVP